MGLMCAGMRLAAAQFGQMRAAHSPERPHGSQRGQHRATPPAPMCILRPNLVHSPHVR